MGDKENTIQYTEEELEEIERITQLVTGNIEPSPDLIPELPADKEEPEDIDFGDIEDVGLGEPDDLDLPVGDLENITSDTDDIPDISLDELSGEMTEIEPEALDSIESLEPVDTLEDLSGPDDVPEIKVEGIEDIAEDEFEDISGLIKDVEEEDAPGDIEDLSSDMLEDLDDIAEDLPEGIDDTVDETAGIDEPVTDDIDDLMSLEDPESIEAIDDIGDMEDISAEVEAEKDETPEFAESSLDQLSALTADEPESIDSQDLADDEFVDTVEDMTAPAIDDPVDSIDVIDDLTGDDLSVIDESVDSIEETADTVSDEVSLDKGIDMDIPDLDDLSFAGDDSDIPEAVETEIPDLEIENIGIGSDEDISSDDDFAPPDDLGEIDISPEVSADGDDAFEVDDIKTEDADIPGISDIEPVDLDSIDDTGDTVEDDSFVIEPLDDEGVPDVGPVEGLEDIDYAGDDEGVELSDKELKKLKKAVLLFNTGLKSVIISTVVNDELQGKELRQLVDMIIGGKPEDNIHRFLEKKLDREIEAVDEDTGTRRRVITAREEYTREGRDRQKRLLKVTRVIGIVAAVTFVLTILGYQYIYKPKMAEIMINEGSAIILSSGDYQKKPADYVKAEEIFRDVDENYVKNFIYGYNEYAKAYFDKGEYIKSLNKLDKGYTLDRTNTDILNSLGYYYSKVPKTVYRALKPAVEEKYYKNRKLKEDDKSQLNVAINFFKRSLLIKKDNIAAMYGIGDAYFNQGLYLKAKKYYEDILRIDKDSVIGYSGLANLYVERNAFPEVVSIYNILREKEMMHEIPPSLLGKMAIYFLDKRASDKGNVRIDYGVRSSKIKDIDDNTYPAVNYILKAINKRDPDYPPLQLYYAKLKKAQNNLLAMKRYLERGVELSPEYYEALHFLGEYYYNVNRPVEAYKYLKKAEKVYTNQPKFTKDEFYKELVTIGKTHSIFGNIFYYYFDKIRNRFGDLDDENLDNELDKLANYNVAREKYEKALSEKYESPEVHYNLGRIYYMNKLFRKSLDQWLHLYEDFVKRPELMFALGNAFYHMGNYGASKGEYLKLVSIFEYEADKIRNVLPGENIHVRIFQTLASVYNNLGAVYQLQNDNSRSSISYWKAVDYAKRLNLENEFARVNLARSYKPERKTDPILDENIPYSIKYYRESLRK